MAKSSIPTVTAPLPVFGTASAPDATREQLAAPLSCLAGCAVDHVEHATQGYLGKQCHASVHTAAITPSYGEPRWLIGGFACTEGGLLMAEVGILREGEHEDRAVYFDPAAARELAEMLLRGARQAEDLARTARVVPVAGDAR